MSFGISLIGYFFQRQLRIRLFISVHLNPNYPHVSHLCLVVLAPLPVHLNQLLLSLLSQAVHPKSVQRVSRALLCCLDYKAVDLTAWITDLILSAVSGFVSCLDWTLVRTCSINLSTFPICPSETGPGQPGVWRALHGNDFIRSLIKS